MKILQGEDLRIPQDSVQDQIDIAMKEQRKSMKTYLKHYLSTAPLNPPLIFEDVNARDFVKYLITLKNLNKLIK